MERFTATVFKFISAVACIAETSIFAVELQEATAKLPVTGFADLVLAFGFGTEEVEGLGCKSTDPWDSDISVQDCFEETE